VNRPGALAIVMRMRLAQHDGDVMAIGTDQVKLDNLRAQGGAGGPIGGDGPSGRCGRRHSRCDLGDARTRLCSKRRAKHLVSS
jgi:hypothetical protein